MEGVWRWHGLLRSLQTSLPMSSGHHFYHIQEPLPFTGTLTVVKTWTIPPFIAIRISNDCSLPFHQHCRHYPQLSTFGLPVLPADKPLPWANHVFPFSELTWPSSSKENHIIKPNRVVFTINSQWLMRLHHSPQTLFIFCICYSRQWCFKLPASPHTTTHLTSSCCYHISYLVWKKKSTRGEVLPFPFTKWSNLPLSALFSHLPSW